jgi:8-oxo-(d)GTP phosphatase
MVDLVKRIVAAGTVTLRNTAGSPEILLVHRPRYDDWTLPKGKLEAGEYLATCAVRETAEESSVSTRLGLPVTEITYPIGSGVKAVTYWVSRAVDERKHKPNNEVDQVGWFSVTSALRQNSYADEREVIRQAVNLPPTTPLMILRHAKAVSRSEWHGGSDQERGLDDRGQRQSKALIPLLDAYGVRRVITSAAARCVKTVRPFAKARDLAVDARDPLTEEAGLPDLKAVTKHLRKIAVETAATGVPTVVCGHRPVLPAMLAGVGIEPPTLAPAAALIAHLAPSGDVVAVELHKPLF